MTVFRKLKENLLNIIFTRRCAICGDVCDIRSAICDRCVAEPNRINGKICMKCGLEKENCNCGNNRFILYESVCAPFRYMGAPRSAISKLKFNHRKEMAIPLGEEMASCVRNRYKNYDFDLCTYMPCQESTLKERGYNQAELLARRMSKSLNIPCVPLIKKDFETEAQHNLPLYLRTGNLAGALSFDDSVLSDISDTRILLCDDIKTSGNTLNECAKILLLNGAAEVRCVTLCIAHREME